MAKGILKGYNKDHKKYVLSRVEDKKFEVKYIPNEMVKKYNKQQEFVALQVDMNGNPLKEEEQAEEEYKEEDDITLTNLDTLVDQFEKYDKFFEGEIPENDDIITAVKPKKKPKKLYQKVPWTEIVRFNKPGEIELSSHSPIPLICRVRKVSIDKNNALSCSCCHFERNYVRNRSSTFAQCICQLNGSVLWDRL